ncbi:MAG: hypothetical protein E7Z86_03140 [Methanosphaera stadtmanae]|jgi:predicted  nucleic acid-binding Zn-ribbon protein|nr:hypothetical protein [Methanosphaera stadtmanae]
MATCKLCGHEFDESKEELLECNCGCGGDKVSCPNCGYEVRITSNVAKRPVKEEEAGLLGKFIQKFRMDS